MLETDYLVVGAGMAGTGFVDSLLDVSDADVVMVDRRHAPGGHWLSGYPFVRLHQPSAWYGVGSTPLDDDRIEASGPEEGQYARASGVELQAYFAALMRDRLVPSGRVRFLPFTDHLGDGQLRSLLDGQLTEVRVRRKVVDASYTPSSTPETYAPPFEVAEGVRLVTPAGLTRLDGAVPAGIVVIGAGKTAMDTCVWLLENGCPPERITWIRKRDAWLSNRHYLQPGLLSVQTVEGTVHYLEALAQGGTPDDVFARLEDQGVLLRIDHDVWPTVFRGPTISEYEVTQLRRIRQVVRLGRVTRIEPDRVVLADGEVPVTPGYVHVHCAAPGLTHNPPVPVFGEDHITVQYLTRASMPLSSAAIARIEVMEAPLDEKNRLCPPIPLPETPRAYLRMLLAGLATEGLWRAHPDLRGWFDSTRVNAVRSRAGQDEDPARRALYGRLLEALGPAYENLSRLGEGEAFGAP